MRRFVRSKIGAFILGCALGTGTTALAIAQIQTCPQC